MVIYGQVWRSARLCVHSKGELAAFQSLAPCADKKQDRVCNEYWYGALHLALASTGIWGSAS